MYKKIIRPILFWLSPERVHRVTLHLLGWFRNGLGHWILRLRFRYRSPELERDVFGIRFPNPIGMSAGFDTDARHYRELAALGFGFVEAGTMTLRPQPGNMRSRRLRRKVKTNELIIRTGFANGGMESALHNLRRRGIKRKVLIGANIAKNTITHDEDAETEILRLFRNLYEYVDYFVVNFGIAGGVDFPTLQNKEAMLKILNALFDFRRGQNAYRAVCVKISPDWSKELIDDVIDILIDTPLDGLVVSAPKHGEGELQNYGISGQELLPRTLELVRYACERMHNQYPVIASGGIYTPKDAQAALDAGASLVEIYTSFVYNGPSIVRKMCRYLDATAKVRKNPKP